MDSTIYNGVRFYTTINEPLNNTARFAKSRINEPTVVFVRADQYQLQQIPRQHQKFDIFQNSEYSMC